MAEYFQEVSGSLSLESPTTTRGFNFQGGLGFGGLVSGTKYRLFHAPMILNVIGPTVPLTDVFFNVVIRWIKPTAVNHQLIIQDNTRTVNLVSVVCDAADRDSLEINLPLMKGLYVSRIDSGSVEIHYSNRLSVIV